MLPWQQVLQLLLGPDVSSDEGLYCVLGTGSCRFTTTKAQSAAEAFLISPWELSHADHKPLHEPTAAAAAAAGSAQLDSVVKQPASPVLTVELFSTKRWGSDALVAAGELLLAPYLAVLQPNEQPGVDVKVVLARAGGKAAGKAAKAAGGGSSSASAAAGESGGSDSIAVVLQLATLTAPPVPEHLLGGLQLKLRV